MTYILLGIRFTFSGDMEAVLTDGDKTLAVNFGSLENWLHRDLDTIRLEAIRRLEAGS